MEGGIEFDAEQLKDAQELLNEYYIQSVEDCRTIGTQKYHVSVSIAAALGALLYGIFTETDNIFENQFFPILILAAFIVLFNLYSAFFLYLHLNAVREIIVKTEMLQKDLLFRKMGEVPCFKWKSLERNKDFKNYLQKQFVLYSIRKINHNNEKSYSIELVSDNFWHKRFVTILHGLQWILNDSYFQGCLKKVLGSHLKKYSKSCEISLNCSSTEAFLSINGINVDKFKVKKHGEDDFLLSEPELKHRFRDIGPHSAVYKSAKSNNRLAILGTVLLILILLYIYSKVL